MSPVRDPHPAPTRLIPIGIGRSWSIPVTSRPIRHPSAPSRCSGYLYCHEMIPSGKLKRSTATSVRCCGAVGAPPSRVSPAQSPEGHGDALSPSNRMNTGPATDSCEERRSQRNGWEVHSSGTCQDTWRLTYRPEQGRKAAQVLLVGDVGGLGGDLLQHTRHHSSEESTLDPLGPNTAANSYISAHTGGQPGYLHGARRPCLLLGSAAPTLRPSSPKLACWTSHLTACSWLLYQGRDRTKNQRSFQRANPRCLSGAQTPDWPASENRVSVV